MRLTRSLRLGVKTQSGLALALLLVLASSSPAQSPASDSIRIARLTAVGHLWGVVRYFHPALGDRDGGWDASTAAGIEQVRAARSTGEYAAAVDALLATLHDPATHVLSSLSSAAPKPAAQRVTIRWEGVGADSTLVVAIAAFDTAATAQLRQFAEPIQHARRVVFDLRESRRSDESDAAGVFADARINPFFAATSVAVPPLRTRMHSGFPSQVGENFGDYWAGTYDQPGAVFRSVSDTRARRIVFLVRAASDVPPIAFALRTNGQGAIVVDGDNRTLESTASLDSLSLGEGLMATVRIGETAGSQADTAVMRAGSLDAPMGAALFRAHAVIAPLPVAPVERHDEVDSLPRAAYPTVGYRVLAAYQWWNAIHYFYPYKELIGENWSALLPHSIARLEAAPDSLGYGLALAEMASHLHDSHAVVVAGGALRTFYGLGTVGAQVQYIGGEPVVVAILNDSATKASGLAVGDVILQVDGEDVAVKRARVAPTIATSTPQALERDVASMLLRGPVGVARITVRDRNDQVRQRSVRRAASISLRYQRTSPILRMLPGNVGYADLDRLTYAMLDSMFEMFKNTAAIIFDDRGYPLETAWSIAPRLTDKESVPVALFERPLVMSPDSSTWATYRFVQSLPTTTKSRYHGKVVLLVDERAQSQSEHTGLFLEAATHLTIVGSPTAGANGDVTAVAFAGRARAYFTGHNVRHADGRQLQRVGLRPDILVRPTLKGVRAGRDEVLERPLLFLGVHKEK